MEDSSIDDSFIEAPIAALSHPLNPLSGVDRLIQRPHINILTYNIFLRPPLIKNNESDHKNDRLKEFIKALGDFDIVCLQEMFGTLNKRKHKLIRCATKAGFLYYADSPSPSFFTSFVVDGGLLILSRFPILVSEFKPYPYGIFSDSLSQKGVLYNKIQIRDEMLHIFGTHTQASYFGENQRYPILTRSDQFTTFRQFIESTLKKHGYRHGEVILLMGDFNVDSRKPYIETNKIKHYPGFKDYPHLGRTEMFNEYDAMMCYLSDNFRDGLVDLIYTPNDQDYSDGEHPNQEAQQKEHPITYADSIMNENGDLVPKETVLTHKDDLCSNQSLDYIFHLNPKALLKKLGCSEKGEGANREGKLQIVKGSAKVEPFMIGSKTFTQLSDHYGISVRLKYKDTSSPRKEGRSLISREEESFEELLNRSTSGKVVIDLE